MEEPSTFLLSKYSLWIVIIGCVITASGACIQYVKDIKQAKKEVNDALEALETEKRRVAEHDTLQAKSNTILDSTKKVLGDTKVLLGDAKHLLDKADTTIAGLSGIILTQTDIINRQISTLSYLGGTDTTPKLIIRTQPFLNSVTNMNCISFLK